MSAFIAVVPLDGGGLSVLVDASARAADALQQHIGLLSVASPVVYVMVGAVFGFVFGRRARGAAS